MEPSPAVETDRGAQLLSRMERVAFSSWHTRSRVVIGSATFFDAFGAMTIAFVLPSLIGIWKLSSGQIGAMISVGYVGQIFGALFFGWLAERIGRTKAVACAMTLDGIMCLCCAFSGSFMQLAAFRVIQGVGLGGEVPVAAAYINELSRARGRGRFVMLYETIFAVGVLGASLLGILVVPRLGWQSMFFISGIPALIIAFLVNRLPESPRWLIGKNRLDQAESVIVQAESSTPERLEPPPARIAAVAPAAKTRWTELFSPFYRGRTLVVWGLWAAAYFTYYGLGTWMPSIYRTVYKLSVTKSLEAAAVANVLQVLCCLALALLIDKTGRKRWFIGSFLLGGALLLCLGLVATNTVSGVLVLGSLSYGVVSTSAMLLYLYTPEVYPTRMRAVGTGLATSWLRLASAVGPFVVGMVIHRGVASVFLLFAGIAVIGAVAALGAIETGGKQLEEIAP